LSPLGLAMLADSTYQPARHLILLAEKLRDVAAGACRRLMVQMPPRHGKSSLVSRYFPAWYLGLFPDREIMLASYEHDFAAGWGARARDTMREFGTRLWGVSLAKGRESADDWGLAGHAGGMVCAGVGGPITGRGANPLIIDDPCKGAEEASSEVYRQRAWDWYRAVAYTRLAPTGAIILITTRWREDDLAGRILANPNEDGEAWTGVSLPAIAEGGDPLGRQPGEALWPQQYPIERLRAIKADIGSYWFEALYQGRPGPPEGALVRKSWWQYWDRLPQTDKGAPDFDEMLMSVDCAFGAGPGSDYVVIQVWGRRGAECWLVDQVRERMDFVQTLEGIKRLAKAWPGAVLKLIEEAANGPAVMRVLRQTVRGIVPVKVNPRRGKRQRLQAVLPVIEAGQVYLPSPATHPWVDAFIEEVAAFPMGRFDDQVDAMSQSLERLGPRVKARPVLQMPGDSRIEEEHEAWLRKWALGRPKRETRDEYVW
jgi:predicted phage terminase large subunit-like protein